MAGFKMDVADTNELNTVVTLPWASSQRPKYELKDHVFSRMHDSTKLYRQDKKKIGTINKNGNTDRIYTLYDLSERDQQRIIRQRTNEKT